MKKDIYQSITDQIVSSLEKACARWHQPWSASHIDGPVDLPQRHHAILYRGANMMASGCRRLPRTDLDDLQTGRPRRLRAQD
jgi:antirestriction protein ArdC